MDRELVRTGFTKPDIVAVMVQEGVELRQKGRDFWARCPFHADKTPSFKVSPERQRFYCFSCGEKGDGIDFIIKLHSLTFKEALKYLGIGNGKPIEIDPREKKKRRLVKGFEVWRLGYYQELCDRRLIYERLTHNLKTMEEAERVAWAFHKLPVIEHRLDILSGQDEESIFDLFREMSQHV